MLAHHAHARPGLAFALAQERAASTPPSRRRRPGRAALLRGDAAGGPPPGSAPGPGGASGDVPAARSPRPAPLDERLLVLRAGPADGAAQPGAFEDRLVRDLPTLLAPGDLLVVNDAATLPASLTAVTADGEDVEVRLLAEQPDDGGGSRWLAVLFGEGDWRTRTEDRPAPPTLQVGETLRFGPDLHAGIDAVHEEVSARLVEIRFDAGGDAFWQRLYRHGRPVQYAHAARPLALWDVQTPYATRPWSAELPSAGRPLVFSLLAELRTRGIELATVTHAAGLSATGDPALDAALPLPERYAVAEATVRAIERTRARGGRVIAVGTSVTRALEGAYLDGGGQLRAGEGVTALRIGPTHRLAVVDGLLTGLHEPGGSHYQLLQAFVPGPALERAYAHALESGYLWHEFGDSCLLLPERPLTRP